MNCSLMADRILDDGDLADVQEELHGTESKWKTIGIQLKLPIQCLKEIEREKKGDPEECSIEMQIEWQEGYLEILGRSSQKVVSWI